MATSYKIVYDLLKEVREDQKKHGEELAKQSVWLESIKQDVQTNTSDLSEHIKRTQLNEDQIDILKKMQESTEKRIVILEEPSKVSNYLYKKWVKYLAILSAIATIVAVFLRSKGVI